MEYWLRLLLTLFIGAACITVGIDYLRVLSSGRWFIPKAATIIQALGLRVYQLTGITKPDAWPKDKQFDRVLFTVIVTFVGTGALFVAIGNLIWPQNSDTIQSVAGYKGSFVSIIGNPPVLIGSALVGVIVGVLATRRCSLLYKVLASVSATLFSLVAFTAATYHTGPEANKWFAIGMALAILCAIVVRLAHKNRQEGC